MKLNISKFLIICIFFIFSKYEIVKATTEEENFLGNKDAKVIVIDDTEMLIGSANLTHHGTEVNFELGVLIRGPIAKEMLRNNLTSQ